MIRRISAILLLLTSLFTPLALSAQNETPLDRKEARKVVGQLTADYKNWNKAAWSGKLRAAILPVSVTMKTYMERGKLTLISLRAPFVGEAARIEVDKDSAIIVNKLSKKYAVVKFDRFGALAPDIHSALQAFLLGRAVVMPEGELSKSNADLTDVFPLEQGGWMVVPKVPDGFNNGVYGYTFNTAAQLVTIAAAIGHYEPAMVSTPDGMRDEDVFETEYTAQAMISYGGSGGEARVAVDLGSKKIEATIEAGEIEWGAKGFERISLAGLRQVGVRQVISM